MSDNERARARAIAAGRQTFPYEVVETWQACVTCGRRIFRTATHVKRPGMYRLCDCPDVVWHQDIYGRGWDRPGEGGWVKLKDDGEW